MKRGIKITERFTSSDSEVFKKYLSDVSNISMFETAEEEAKCAEKAIAGDEKALQELIYRNLRFVISVAKQYQTNGVFLEDLVNEGNLGLLHATKKFDPKSGNKFISYAVWWIRAYVQTYVNNNARQIRIPINKNVTLNAFRNKVDIVRQIVGKEPSTEELIEHIIDMSEKEILEMVKINSMSVTSFDKNISDDDDSGTLSEFLVSDIFEPTDYLVNKDDSKNQLYRLMSSLKENEIFVLKAYFGLDSNYQMSLSDISEKMGISGEGVRLIKEKAIKKLKRLVNQHGITTDMF